MLDNPFHEEIFPNDQSKPLLAQLEAISSCPISCNLGEETNPHLTTTTAFFRLGLVCKLTEGALDPLVQITDKREENLLAILKRRWWKYMILGIIDIEANYLVVKAYQYTTLTSVQLLDCFVIPVVILLSWFFLLVRYKAVHFIGIVVCILGMGCMAGADVLVGRQQGAGENKLIGDLLVLGGATLYGISNVCEEYIVRNLSRVEFLGMIGLFGSFFSGIQLAIMEHKELLKVPWDWQIGLLYVGFSACMFGLYSFMPVVIKKTSATAVNLSLLTADLYSLFCGLFLFHYKFSGLYLLSFFTILVGLMLYSSTSTYVAQDPRVYKQFRNPSGPVVDLPATGQLEPSVTYTSLGQETEEEPHVRVA
ncbi:Solute carrier family 35 member F1 [Pitangus sulphuratus]|nr:Solute carrier family 35 member F1 [Pitangus sulphuratus]